MHLSPPPPHTHPLPIPGGLACCSFLGDGSVVAVDSLFLRSSVDVCFVMHYFSDYMQLSWRGSESWLLSFIVFLVSCDCSCYVALPRGTVGWSAECDCGISRSYITFRLGSGTRMINTPVCLISLSLVGSEHSAFTPCVPTRGTWKSDPYIHIQFNHFTSSQAFLIEIWKLTNKPFL